MLIFPSEPSRERVKVSHVIVECRVINHHPDSFFSKCFYIELNSRIRVHITDYQTFHLLSSMAM